jgi:hypothetical protein
MLHDIAHNTARQCQAARMHQPCDILSLVQYPDGNIPQKFRMQPSSRLYAKSHISATFNKYSFRFEPPWAYARLNTLWWSVGKNQSIHAENFLKKVILRITFFMPRHFTAPDSVILVFSTTPPGETLRPEGF